MQNVLIISDLFPIIYIAPTYSAVQYKECISQTLPVHEGLTI